MYLRHISSPSVFYMTFMLDFSLSPYHAFAMLIDLSIKNIAVAMFYYKVYT